MRNLPGWVVGALGVGVVVAAFFLGGQLAAADLTPRPLDAIASSPVSHVPAASYRPATVTRVSTVPAASASRAPVSRTRSTKKSIAIIAGSTAAGAVIGGLTKGKKGAVIGGLIGGGAATIWDQVTRRRAR